MVECLRWPLLVKQVKKSIQQVSEIEEMVNKTVELKLEEFRSSQGPLSAAVRRGGRETGRQRPGPKPTDVCRACNGRGHWARSCQTLNSWPRTPTPALNSCKGVNYPYLPQKEPILNTVHRGKAASRGSYYVKGTVNKGKAIFLVDTGAEVSLISSSTPGLVINDSQVSPVVITHQPIAVCGEAEVRLELGGARG